MYWPDLSETEQVTVAAAREWAEMISSGWDGEGKDRTALFPGNSIRSTSKQQYQSQRWYQNLDVLNDD